MEPVRQRSPWFWVPSLYFAEGIPYVIVMTTAVVMYKRLGVSNEMISFFTSWLYLPWVIKPLWSPMVDITRTKRFWIVSMQFLVAIGLALAAAVVPMSCFFALSLVIFAIMAFASATHDIAADGFYMLSLSQHKQALWVGWRSTFYRGAMIVGSGWLVTQAGDLETRLGSIPRAWSATLFLVAGSFFLFAVWHWIMLPRPAGDETVLSNRKPLEEFFPIFASFFRKPGIGMAAAFILLYRFDEAQLVKIIPVFMLDKRAAGGLGLVTKQVGLAYEFGVASLLAGGILGGFLVARFGLKRMLPIMACAMYLPKLVWVFASFAQPSQWPVIYGCFALEQFGYGFGFAAFMLFLLYFADGPHRTAHYAICTGLMALGMMIPGLWAGWLEEQLGYRHFFIWVLCSAIPGFTVAMLLKVDEQFGKKLST